jgi:hypothetical protein
MSVFANGVKWITGGGFVGTLNWTPTATRTVTMPDADGTLLFNNGQSIGATTASTGRFTTVTVTTPPFLQVNRTAALSLTGTNPNKIIFDTIAGQTPTSLYSTSTGAFTATSGNTGWYIGSGFISATGSALSTIVLYVYKNGSIFRVIGAAPLTSNEGFTGYMPFSFNIPLTTANDFLEIFISSNVSQTLTMGVGAAACYLDLMKRT